MLGILVWDCFTPKNKLSRRLFRSRRRVLPISLCTIPWRIFFFWSSNHAGIDLLLVKNKKDVKQRDLARSVVRKAKTIGQRFDFSRSPYFRVQNKTEIHCAVLALVALRSNCSSSRCWCWILKNELKKLLFHLVFEKERLLFHFEIQWIWKRIPDIP